MSAPNPINLRRLWEKAGLDPGFLQGVEDPMVLLKPWVMPTVIMRNTGGNTIIGERGSCTDNEQREASSQYRH